MLRISSIINQPARLRGREKGRRAFILANGPSILKEDLSRLRGEVVIGMNASTMLESQHGFEAGYYVLSDIRFLDHPEKRRWATEALSPSTVRVLRSELREYDDPAFESRTYYTRSLGKNGFSTDLQSGFFFGCTTTMLAIQLAHHLGCLEVYLLGADLRYPPDSPRFYAESKPQDEDIFTSVQISNIATAAKRLETFGTVLVNCSARSMLRPYLPFKSFSEVVA